MFRLSAIVVALAALAVPAAAPAPGPSSLRILFVGNSLRRRTTSPRT